MDVRRRLILVALLGWMVWRGGSGAWALVGELRTSDGRWRAALLASEDERLARTLGRADRAQGLAPGAHLAIYRAIVEHVEPHAVIEVVRVPGRQVKRRLPMLNTLVVPRVFRRVPASGDALPPPKPSTWFLGFDDELGERIAAVRTPVARGDGWTLWR